MAELNTIELGLFGMTKYCALHLAWISSAVVLTEWMVLIVYSKEGL